MAKPDLTTINGLLAECGCCGHPECCGPLVQFQSGFGRSASKGFIDWGSGDDRTDSGFAGNAWKQTRYLRFITRQTGVGADPIITDYPDIGAGSYTSHTLDVDWVHDFIQEYSQGFNASVSGAPFVGQCDSTEEVYSFRCIPTGGWTERQYAEFEEDDVWDNYLAQQSVGTISDAEGEETEAHSTWETDSAAWDAAHPDYPAEVAAYEAAHAIWQADYDAWQVTYDAWAEAWNAWDAGGQIGEEPVEPEPFTDEEPTLADPRPDEPEEFYGPCTQKTTIVTTLWDRIDGEIVLRESTEEEPNPSTYVDYSGSTVGGPGSPAYEDWEYIYEEPVTFEDWLALVEAWFASRTNFDHADDSGSDGCFPGTGGVATKRIGDYSVVDEGQSYLDIDFFRFRIKLNKCCAWKNIRSEWSRVFYPREWLEWLAEKEAVIGSDPVPPEPADRPERTPQAWVWTGEPPRCDESDSGDPDPYDYEPMWSPWSLVIQLPDGVEGTIANRNYQQKCHNGPFQKFPAVFGTYEHDSESI